MLWSLEVCPKVVSLSRNDEKCISSKANIFQMGNFVNLEYRYPNLTFCLNLFKFFYIV